MCHPPFKLKKKILNAITSLFDSVVTVVFQITFRAKIHVNDFFIFKKLFLTSAHQNDPKHTKHIKF
jgi:hypothetical protein